MPLPSCAACGRVATALPFMLPRFIPIFRSLPDQSEPAGPTFPGDWPLAMEVTRGLPRNVTTEMDLALWQAAAVLRADPEAARLFRELDAAALAGRYLDGQPARRGPGRHRGFMEKYGMRGVGEIDFGQPRWREEPAPVMHALHSYLDIDPQVCPGCAVRARRAGRPGRHRKTGRDRAHASRAAG